MWPFKRSKPKRVPALFLHIQKTAGSALVETLRPYYGPSIITHGDYIGHRPEEFRDIQLVSGHFGYAFAKVLMPGRYAFTFLRDPVERVLSFYYFCRKQNSAEFPTYALARDLELEPFLVAVNEDIWIRKNVWNNQAWQLARGFGYVYTPSGRDPVTDEILLDESTPEEILALAIAHLDEFSHVGFAESFELDRNAICADLGVSTRFSKKSAPPPLRAPDLPPSTLQLVRSLTSLDQALYDAAQQRRAGRA